MSYDNRENDFNVWPVLIDMITSVLIIFILFSFFDQVLNQRNLNLLLISKKRQAFVEDFNKKFYNETTRDSTILLSPDFNYLEIRFSNHILFETGNYQIKQAGKDILGKCASFFKEVPNLDISQIQVEGHTDIDAVNQVSEKIMNNWDLSAARAIEVVRLFTETWSLDPKLFSANGYSQFDPIAEGNSIAAKEKNRRVELKIYFKGI